MSDSIPPNLSKSGLKLWEKYGPERFRRDCYSIHFKDYGSYSQYVEEQEISRYKKTLLDGVADPDSIDPRFLRNLCKELSRIDNELNDKADRPYD